MVIKKVKDRKRRGVERTSAYIADARHAGDGKNFGPKVEFSGTLNTVSEDWHGATAEISALCGAYKAEGATSAHWIISLQEGERFTQETAQDAVQTVLRNLGMEDHPCVWAVHDDKKNHHIHMCFSRVAPEPAQDGEYKICWRGATIQSKNGNNEVASGHAALAELCDRHGFKPEAKARYRWEDGKAVRNTHAADPAQGDAIRLGQRVESWEARSGIKHPKRLLAETALEAIRSSKGDKTAAVALLAAAGIQYTDVDYLDAKGRRHQGGKLTGPHGEEVKLSALPKDCSYLSKQPSTPQPPISTSKASHFYAQITTHGGAKKYIKQAIAESSSGAEFFEKLSQKNLIFEKTGKAGGRVRYGTKDTEIIKLSECGASFLDLSKKFDDFSHYAEKIHGNQEKFNGEFQRRNGNVGNVAENNNKNSIAAQARYIFETAQTTREMHEALESQGITFTREVATDQKSGRQFEYGRLARENEAITLKSLGIKQDGKPEFTLAGLDRVFLARDAAQVLRQAKSWSEAETMLAVDSIRYARVKTTTANGAEVIVGRLERDGVTSTTGLAGKEFQPAALDARYMPYAVAKAHYEAVRLEKNPVAALAQKGLTVSDVDRIGRVGEKLEPTLRKQDKPAQAGHAPAAHTPRPDSSITPRSINEILDLIEQSAKNAAALAAANAKAGQAAWAARAAESRAEQAEKALADLKASITHEKPATDKAAAKEKVMLDLRQAPKFVEKTFDCATAASHFAKEGDLKTAKDYMGNAERNILTIKSTPEFKDYVEPVEKIIESARQEIEKDENRTGSTSEKDAIKAHESAQAEREREREREREKEKKQRERERDRQRM